MGIERYNVSLDTNVVDEAKTLFEGQKLSPLLNDLLKKWIQKKKEKK